MRDHPARNRPESKIALVSGAARGTGASVVRGGILMRYALRRARGVRQDPAATFGVARTPVPWHGLMLACAASQLGGALVPLPGGLGGVESGALGALALSGTHPATAAGGSSCTGWPGTGYLAPPALSPPPRSPGVLGLLTGVWVTLSSWFITLQHGGGKHDLAGDRGLSIRPIAAAGTAPRVSGEPACRGGRIPACQRTQRAAGERPASVHLIAGQPESRPADANRMVVASEDHFGWTEVRAVTVSNEPVQGGAVEPAVRSGTADVPVAPAARGVVSRHALFARLSGAARVTEVSAPAGSGKTFLLQSWISEAVPAGRAAWVSVQGEERDPQRFWIAVADAPDPVLQPRRTWTAGQSSSGCSKTWRGWRTGSGW